MNTDGWTYGCEFEFADWDIREGYAPFERDPETAVCNTNGIATDPTNIGYPFGGEVKTPPSSNPRRQVKYLEQFLKMHPIAAVTHRAGLQVHIRVPGLSKTLEWLKTLQLYVSQNFAVYPMVDPLPLPMQLSFHREKEWKEAKKRQHWMRMSHWTVIPANRVAKQMEAKTVTEFLEAAVPRSKVGKPLWHAQPRAAVNIRQLLQTDTIEFRFWSATKDSKELFNAILFCRDYMLDAFNQQHGAVTIFHRYYRNKPFPKTDPFVYYREKRWQATSITKHKRPVIERNIELILSGKFDDGPSCPGHLIP